MRRHHAHYDVIVMFFDDDMLLMAVYKSICRAEVVEGNMKIYAHFLSFLNIEVAQKVEMLPHDREGTANHMQLKPWRLTI